MSLGRGKSVWALSLALASFWFNGVAPAATRLRGPPIHDSEASSDRETVAWPLSCAD
jgi:hypothetical protein